MVIKSHFLITRSQIIFVFLMGGSKCESPLALLLEIPKTHCTGSSSLILNVWGNDFFSGRLDEAFSHCVAVWKTKAFKDSLEWVACCVEMFEVRACF